MADHDACVVTELVVVHFGDVEHADNGAVDPDDVFRELAFRSGFLDDGGVRRDPEDMCVGDVGLVLSAAQYGRAVIPHLDVFLPRVTGP